MARMKRKRKTIGTALVWVAPATSHEIGTVVVIVLMTFLFGISKSFWRLLLLLLLRY